MSTTLRNELRSRHSSAPEMSYVNTGVWIATTSETPAATTARARYITLQPEDRYAFTSVQAPVARQHLAKVVQTKHLHRWLHNWVKTTWTPPHGKIRHNWRRQISLWHKPFAHSPWGDLRPKVRSFAHLEKGWDSYDADAPSGKAIRNTLGFLEVLEMVDLMPDWVEPTSDDSIMLEVKVGDVLQEWDFYSDGDVAVMYEWPDGREECRMVKPAVWEMASALTAHRHAAK